MIVKIRELCNTPKYRGMLKSGITVNEKYTRKDLPKAYKEGKIDSMIRINISLKTCIDTVKYLKGK